MKIDRRDFLRTAGGITALSLGLNIHSPAIFKRQILAAPVGGSKKLLYIFQRGGMDGINAVIPRGDSDYNQTIRPTLYITPTAVTTAGTDLGNGFAQLHPRLYYLMNLHAAGQLATIHRVGYKGQSQSHFDSQQYYENGTLDRNLEVGIFNRLIQETIGKAGNNFPAAALSSDLMVALRGPEPVPNFSEPTQFRFRGTDPEINKLLGGTEPRRGLVGFYSGAHDFPGKPYRSLVYRTGNVLAETMNILRQNNINPANYTPANGANYTTNSFGQKLRLCAQLFKQTPVQILGVNIGGWDTHTNQGNAHNGLLYDVARNIDAFSLDMAAQWNDTIVLTMTEFGRTTRENDSFGTDHAYSTATFVAGGAVKGKVYNCDATTWKTGDMFSQSSRYLAHRTDFRAILGEIFMKHFGINQTTLNFVIPGYSSLVTKDPAGFTQLGIL